MIKLKKLPFISYKLLKKNFMKIKQQSLVLTTWSRTSTILPCMKNSTFAIYNGQKHIPIIIIEQIIGYKLGEFSITKSFFSHTKTEKKLIFKKK